MKKICTTLLTAVLLASLTGCGNVPSESDSTPSDISSVLDEKSSVASENASDPENSRDPEQTDIVDIAALPVNHIDWGSIFDNSVSGSFRIIDKLGKNYYGTKGELDGIINYKETIMSEDFKEELPLKYPDNFPEWSIGSDSFVTLDNRYLYEWLSYTSEFSLDSTGHDMKLTRVDCETGAVEVIDEIRSSIPFIYLVKLDEGSFLSYCVSKAESDKTGYATLTTASIYYSDGTKKEIISEKYENDASWTDSIGILIERFAVKDGEIYGFGRRNIQGEYKFFLYHYGKDGKLLDTTPLPGFENVIGKNQPVEIFLVGDYILFRNNEDLIRYICKITEQGVVLLAEEIHYAISGSKIFFIESNVDGSTDTLKDKEIPLYSLDTSTDKIVAVNFDVPAEKPYFVNIAALSNGDLLFQYCPNGEYDPLNYTNYVLPIDKVNALIEAVH